jgi:hypothetical protein
METSRFGGRTWAAEANVSSQGKASSPVPARSSWRREIREGFIC